MPELNTASQKTIADAIRDYDPPSADSIAELIVQERNRKPFSGQLDFLDRFDINPDVLEYFFQVGFTANGESD